MITPIGRPIFPKIAERFSIRQVSPEFNMADMVYPITDTDKILRKLKFTETTGLDLTTGGSFVTILTVPKGKRYYIKAIGAFRSSGSTATLSSPAVRLTGSGNNLVLNSVTAGTSSYYFLPQELGLNEGESVSIQVGTGNAGDTATGRCIYEEIDLG